MALLVPFGILFIGKRKPDQTKGMAIPTLVEVLLLVTLVSISLPMDDAQRVAITGIWGVVTQSIFAEFHWYTTALVIIVGYQLVYLKDFRLNITPLDLLLHLVIASLMVVKESMRLFASDFHRFKQYSSLNWIAPLKIILSRRVETGLFRLKTVCVHLLEKMYRLNFIQNLTKSVKSILGFEHKPLLVSKTSLTGELISIQNCKNEMLSQAVLVYTESNYLTEKMNLIKVF